jgi:hypothetical protein
MGEEDDYAEPGVRHPRRWTGLEVAILTAAIGLALPVVFILGLFALWAAFPDQ